MSNSASNTTCFPESGGVYQYDGDVAGVGVRLSFYIQNFLLVLLVDRSYEDAENALWTFIATSFGLTVAALVQVRLRTLSLLEGILVSQLQWLANLGTFLALASYSRSKGKDNLVKIAAVFQGYLSMILTIVMWAWADRFSGGTPCNEGIKFIFLFAVNVPALGTGRIIALVCASVTMLIYTAVTFTECMAWRRHGMSHLSMREASRDPDVELTSKAIRKGSTVSGRDIRRRKSTASQSRKRHPRHPSRQQWLGTDVDPIFFGILFTQAIIFAYFVSTTEAIVHQTHVHVSGTNQWGFGQVLALAVVFPSVISLVRAIQRNRIAKLKKQEREKDENEAWKIPASPEEGQSDPTTRARPPLSVIPPSSHLGRGIVASPSSGLAPADNLQLREESSISSSSVGNQYNL